MTQPADETANFFAAGLEEHMSVARLTREALLNDLTEMLGLWITCVRGGGKILFFGNGGSASQAQHFAAELVVRIGRTRAALPALALSGDAAILTAAGNDFGFEFVFSRQIEAIAAKNDLAVGLSTAGNSPNVLKALETARARGIATAALLGAGGGAAAEICDLAIVIPSSVTARVQEMHLLLGHLLCSGLERAVVQP